jgi:hypothetical protein
MAVTIQIAADTNHQARSINITLYVDEDDDRWTSYLVVDPWGNTRVLKNEDRLYKCDAALSFVRDFIRRYDAERAKSENERWHESHMRDMVSRGKCNFTVDATDKGYVKHEPELTDAK